jgi:uncharacterized protein (DUF2062 family)
MGWRRLSVYLVKRLTRLAGTPHSIALGFACGAAISFTPFVGTHLILSLLLTYLFRGHLLAAAVGTVVGNPWTFPFIWLSTYKLGQIMLGSGEAAPWPAVTMFKHVVIDLGDLIWPTLTGQVSWEAVRPVLADLQALIWPMTIGSVPLALIFGFGFYFFLVRLIGVYQERRQRRREQRARALANDAVLTSAARSRSCAGKRHLPSFSTRSTPSSG